MRCVRLEMHFYYMYEFIIYMLLHPSTYNLSYAIMLLFVFNLSGTIQTVINLVLNFINIFLLNSYSI